MRITNSIIIRGFDRDINRINTLKNDTMHRITSTRQFNRASEAPLAAAKALNVRKSLYYSAQYKENLKVANNFYTEAETSLLQVSEKLADIRETLIAAVNTTKCQDEYDIYAQQLESFAQEMCSIFNTDTAGRAIFGGESDDPTPFTIMNDANGIPTTAMYHGVPVNAMNDPKMFPYSDEVIADIGLGFGVDQQTQYVDPQSGLRISFNGVEVSGCGAESGVADIDLSAVRNLRWYEVDVYANDVKKTIRFRGGATPEDTVQNIRDELDKAYALEEYYPIIDEQGVISIDNGVVCVVNNAYAKGVDKLAVANDSGYSNNYRVNFDEIAPGREYSVNVKVNGIERNIVFMSSDNADPLEAEQETIANINAALAKAYANTDYKPIVSDGKVDIGGTVYNTPATRGVLTCEGAKVEVIQGGSAVEADTAFTPLPQKFDFNAIENGQDYSFSISIGGVYRQVNFEGSNSDEANRANIERAINSALAKDYVKVSIDNSGNVSASWTTDPKPTVTHDPSAIFQSTGTLDMSKIQDGADYKFTLEVFEKKYSIRFKGGADAPTTVANINKAIQSVVGNSTPLTVEVRNPGIAYSLRDPIVTSTTLRNAKSDDTAFKPDAVYSNNYIQITLDAARALRNGDIDYANGCIDQIVASHEKLLIEIANMGCNEDFIDFNLDRLTTREYNLLERQNDLETADLEKESTKLKTYTAIYNACLQMASQVVPNSIFNYM